MAAVAQLDRSASPSLFPCELDSCSPMEFAQLPAPVTSARRPALYALLVPAHAPRFPRAPSPWILSARPLRRCGAPAWPLPIPQSHPAPVAHPSDATRSPLLVPWVRTAFSVHGAPSPLLLCWPAFFQPWISLCAASGSLTCRSARRPARALFPRAASCSLGRCLGCAGVV
ncbi:uncharacterized protein [Zea mays]|uniref:Uncharacterized protein n=1 Tax=Zea mays TaxID=4577 RepID=C4IYA2_MAIZE|nr:uncharacterized protein LOC118476018 [Zea mays]ACR33902.1 unknown [Zea mays]|eukprot:NP_001170507.1 uncharacterized protein LOC100384513 [Zea mays]